MKIKSITFNLILNEMKTNTWSQCTTEKKHKKKKKKTKKKKKKKKKKTQTQTHTEDKTKKKKKQQQQQQQLLKTTYWNSTKLLEIVHTV